MAINKQNLKVPTSEEARINGAKGGKASGAARRRKKAMKDIALAFGKEEAPAGIIAKFIQLGMLEAGETCTMDEALMLAQYGKALSGNTQAAQFVRDTSGQKPLDQVEVEVKKSKKLDDIFSQLGTKGLDEEE